eukprot:CAMPEP_0184674764 /NCGR_PEP_ID=MMETSP0308-20130426/87422_1 /TAXON_ID=38269 /ORGANISM="Gloeochaete witrockiana, Strain SAG 46.84" /LENGTH=187 /DNA_ID=CAMNT_0027122411 /DNA_START=319 /DNA_END=885 /DNA_ORIENTATION=+
MCSKVVLDVLGVEVVGTLASETAAGRISSETARGDLLGVQTRFCPAGLNGTSVLGVGRNVAGGVDGTALFGALFGGGALADSIAQQYLALVELWLELWLVLLYLVLSLVAELWLLEEGSFLLDGRVDVNISFTAPPMVSPASSPAMQYGPLADFVDIQLQSFRCATGGVEALAGSMSSTVFWIIFRA